MHNAYFWCALVGGSLLVIQLVLQIIGLGAEGDLDAGGADVDVDADLDGHDPAHGTAGNVFFGILSFKAMVSFLAVFGLTGLSLENAGLSPFNQVSLAILAGLIAMVIIAYLMRGLHKLGSSGSVVLRNAVGLKATVYLRIPGEGAGRGKITVEIQERTIEMAAVTDGEPIETGRVVRIVEVLPNETARVEAA
jgi:hypothetical protein